MGMSTGSKVFLGLLVLLGVTAGALLFGGGPDAGLAGDDGAGSVQVSIPEGATASSVADILSEQGVINSTFAFRLAARFDDNAGRIRAGEYDLRPGLSTGEILEQLSAAPESAPSFRLTIPEGLTVAQTLERIAAAEGSPHSVEELTAALGGVALPAWVPADLPGERPYGELTPYEGLLFPETYDFRIDLSAQELLADLVAQTDAEMEQLGVAPEQRYQTLVVASLIEREARVPEEQPVISSVIYNRLGEPMRLQVDATVLYANAAVEAGRVLTSDLEVPSPWNTYVTDGLPPTPISGAGAGALAAAANPDDTPFLFYVVSDPATGAHAFAETYSEHQQNVAEYRAQRDGG